MSRQFLALLAVAVLAAVGGYFAAMQFAPQSDTGPSSGPEANPVGMYRPDFEHADLDGRQVSAANFDGKVVLVNFWASWCEPCVEEMPMLSRLQEEYKALGLQVLGIALDDEGHAATFASELSLSYPVLLGDTDVVVTSRRYGNATGMLPYSVLIDRKGVLRWSRLGVLEEEALLDIIVPLLGEN